MAITPGQNAMYRGMNPEPVILVGQDDQGNLTNINTTDGIPVNVISSVASGGSPIVAGTAPSPVSISTSSAAIVAALSTREMLWLKNMGPNTVYLQHTGAAVLANAFPLLINEVLLLDGEQAKLAWNGICAATESAVIRILPGTV